MNYVRYILATGKIDSWGACPEHMLMYYSDDTRGAVWADNVSTDDYHLWWVKDGVAVPREPAPITVSKNTILADDTDEAVLSGFPADCPVTVDGTEYVISDGELKLTSPMPAVYHLSCKLWPYLDWETSVEAVAV